MRKGGSSVKEKAMNYCAAGENCSLGLLKAAAEVYGFGLSEEMKHSCAAINSGFGVGSFCSALVAAVMIFGILFPAEEAKQKRLLFLMKIREKYGTLDCCTLSANRADCVDLIGEMAELLEESIAL